MNTIHHTRKRPRVDSVNFRSFFWLLRLEAAYMVTCAWWRRHHVGSYERSRVPLDRVATYIGRAHNLSRATPTLRRLE